MLEKFRRFSELPKEHLALLERISRKLSISKGSILFSPGDATRGFYVVMEGAVRLYRVSPKGKEITIEIADTGNTFAEPSIFSDTYHCYAEALQDSRVYLIEKNAFMQMIRGDAGFAVAWIKFLSLDLIRLRHRMEELSLKSPKARIASYVLLLAEMRDSESATLPVHRKSIATLLGMTHETFYRTAKELENEGLVRFDGQKIDIVNRDLLEEIAE